MLSIWWDKQRNTLLENIPNKGTKNEKKQETGKTDYVNHRKNTGDRLLDNWTDQTICVFDNGNRYEIRCSNIICYYTTCC